MKYKSFWKKTKRILALIIALALFLNGWSNYDFTAWAAGAYTVTLSKTTAVYNGQNQLPTVTVEDSDGNELSADDYDVVWTDGQDNNEISSAVNAGTYVCTVTGNSDPSLTGRGSFAIKALDLADCTVTVGSSYEYTGSAIEPTDVQVKNSSTGEIIQNGYIVSFENNTDAGTANVTVEPESGNGNLTGSQNGTFSITAKPLSDDMVSLSKEDAIYTGDEYVLNVEVKDGEKKLTEDTDYTVSPDSLNFTDVGTYSVSVTGSGNYSGTITKSFVISYDSDITKAHVTVTGAVEQNGTWYFKDKAVISAVENYTLVNGEKEISSNENDVKLEVKNNAGAIGLVSLGNFVKDADAPTDVSLDVVYEGEYGTDWAKSISSASFSATDSGSGVKVIYYTTNASVTDVAFMTSCNPGEAVQLSSDATYYFCAEDYAGNVSDPQSLKIRKLDMTPPEIVVKDGEEEIENESTVYLNKDALTNDKKIFTVEVEDTESGYDNTQSINTEFTPAAVDASESHELKNTIRDYVGNEAVHSFTVVYDVDNPVISDFIMTDGDKEDAASILTNKDVTVRAAVTDANLKEVVLVNTENTADRVVMTASTTGTYTHSCTISTDTYKKVSYKIYAYDLAGNETQGAVIRIEIDKVAPELDVSSIAIDQTPNENGWVNADTKFTITIENNDGSSADSYVEYQKKDDTSGSWVKLENPDKNGNIWSFSFTEMDETYNGDYLFRAGDSVGNVSENNPVSYRLQKDKKAPEADGILAEYKADDAASSGKKDFISSIIDRIFAKKQIEITVYIKDQISGVKSINYSFDGQAGTAEADSNATAEIDGENYSIIPITVTVTGEHAGNLIITRIEDRAGVVLEDNVTPSEVAKGTAILVVDSVAPTIAAVYPECNGSENGKKYYRPDTDEISEKVTLTFTEAYFEKQVDAGGNPVKPVIHIRKNKTEENNIDSYVTWSGFENNQIKAEIQLPYEAGQETEYKITATYQDGSGNLLAWEGAADSFSSVTDDGFQSGILILDDKAPELTEFSIDGTTTDKVGGVDVYHNVDGADTTISFAIDDNKDYWNASALSFKIVNMTTKEPVVTLTGDKLDWKDVVDGRIHTTSYEFDGEASVEANYEVQISYADRAGNPMVAGSGLTGGTVAEGTGTFTSEEFILDHVAPTVDIQYSDAHLLVSAAEGTDHPDGVKTPEEGYNSYYGAAEKKIDVTITITETYAVQETDGGLKNCEISLSGAAGGTSFEKSKGWTHSGNKHTVTYTITGDGDYQVKVSYQDAATNRMTDGTTVQGGTVTNGSYESPTLVLDTVAPVIAVPTYSGTSVNTYNGREYFDSSVNLVITVNDQNIRYGELKEVLAGMTAYDSSGNSVDNSAAKTFIDNIDANTLRRGAWKVTIPLSTEANYDIPVAFTDLAGNQAEYSRTLKSCTDTTDPVLENLTENVSASGFLDMVNYKDLGFLFADHKLTIRADVSDGTAGIQTIRFTVTDENGKKTELTKNFAPSPSGVYEIAIPLETSDFKGTIKAEVLDWSNNASDESRGAIVESGSRHSSTGSAVITTNTSPSRTVGGEDFYNTDVKFNLTLKDTYSGLWKWSYTGGSTLSDSMDYAAAAGKDMATVPAEAITYEYSADLTLDSSRNNDNDVKVSAEYTDNTGHTGSVEQFYNIDITAPTITVEYDLNDPSNERYYNQTRTATVTIRERNFDADDVDFTITNTDGAMPAIGGWSESGSGDNTEHVCHVTFSADGDYTFTVAFEDMAGNKADYDRVDEFTIDQTKPVLQVTWDNNQSSHDYYYAQSRTATIDILEHNFDPALIDVIMTANGAGTPSVSGWSRNGDHNIATVTFSADADYTFDISGLDLADNPLDDYEMERFVIDQTAPELEIFDIEHMSANNGVVMPGVRYYDTNYDADATVILMKGYHNGVQEMNGTTTRTANGMEIKLNDFEHIPEVDDLYTMEATVYDLAGNSSEASVIFSVNRFGSVYTFDDKTDELVGDNGKYYTNQEQEIVVIETNVDTLEFQEITCNLNGSLRTLKEGEDFTVGMSGSDVSWKQYTYTIDEKNFTEEGTYILTIYSEDRATNTSDNNTKGKKVEFVVDKTSPSILISGVENDGQYRENSREVTLDVQDNIRLSEVEVTVDGKETTYSASELSEAEGKIVFSVGSANHWQNMSVKAYDAAGNEADSEELRFLITSNILVQFYMNKVVFYSTIGILLLLGAGAWWFLILAKRKKDKEEEE